MKEMALGEIVDFVIDWNERNKSEEDKKKEVSKRKASQADIDAYFGG